MYKSFATLFAIVTAAVASPVLQARDVPAGSALTGISYSGAGCPTGTTQHFLASDVGAFTTTFSEFYTEAIGGVTGSKTCTAALSITVPAGYRVGVAEVTTQGFVQLDNGVSINRSATYSFQGQTASLVSLPTVESGPSAGTHFKAKDTYDGTNTVFSACGTSSVLEIATTISTSTSGALNGYVAVDSLNTWLLWEAC